MAKSSAKKRRTKKRKGRRLSVMVIHRCEDSMELWLSVESYKGRLAAAIRERYAPRLRPGEELPDYVLALELTVRDVQAALAHLIRLDDGLAVAAAQYGTLRREQDRLVREELYPRAVSVRGAIDLAFGREMGAWLHGMKGRTRRRASALRIQLQPTVARLTDPELELPPPRNPHAHVDRKGWVRKLKAPYKKLVKLDGEVVRRRDHLLPGLVADKNAAIKAFDAAYGDALRVVTAAFAAARFDARLIENLRPSYQRRRLARQAEQKRQARAAKAAAATPKAVKPPPGESERLPVPASIAEWLEEHRLFGT